MILVLVQLSFPILAGFGLMKIISLREFKDQKIIKVIKNSAIVFTVIFILSVLLKGSIGDWFTGRISEYVSNFQQSEPRKAQYFTAFSPYMSEMFTGDLTMAFGILVVAFWLAYSYINSRISKDTFILAVIILTIFDLFRIDARGENYVDNPDIKKMFNTPDYITAIKNQKDNEPFRMINIKQDGSLGSFNNNANYNAYFLVEDFYGYSGIKPRSYQDFIDVVGPANETLWRMLNVKYIVTEKPVNIPGLKEVNINQHSVLYINQNALPRVYFIDSIATKPALDFLEMVKRGAFDPQKVGFLENGTLNVEKSDSSAFIHLTKYTDEEISLNVNASGKNFLFVGDTYFPKGWEAKIDGDRTNIYKVDHGFMGIVVTKGMHKVNFIYAPKSYYIGKNISLTLNSFLLIGLLFAAFTNYKKSRKDDRALSK